MANRPKSPIDCFDHLQAGELQIPVPIQYGMVQFNINRHNPGVAKELLLVETTLRNGLPDTITVMRESGDDMQIEYHHIMAGEDNWTSVVLQEPRPQLVYRVDARGEWQLVGAKESVICQLGLMKFTGKLAEHAYDMQDEQARAAQAGVSNV